MHNAAYIAGIGCGLAICIIIGLIFRLRRGKKRNAGTVEFDERQMAARGKAYKAGFFTTLIYTLLFAALSVTELPFFQSVTGMLIGSFLGIAVFAVIAIRSDAYLGLNENKRSFLIFGAIIAVADLISGICAGLEGTLMENGQLTFDCLNLMVGILFAVIIVALLLHGHKGEEEDE